MSLMSVFGGMSSASKKFVDVWNELARATEMHGPLASGHEAVAVIEEEFLEFRSAVFWGVDQKGEPSDPRAEAVQLAAMAIRYLIDVPAPVEYPSFGGGIDEDHPYEGV